MDVLCAFVSSAAETSTSAEPSAVLTLRQAAERLGVHYMTAYRYVQLGQLEASKIGNSWAVSERAIDAFGSTPEETPLSSDEAIERLIEAIVEGDEDAAWDIIDPIVRSNDQPEDIHLEVIGPAMARIGQEWADGKRSIADEHQASAVTRRLLGRIRPSFRGSGRRRGLVVIAAPSGDHHSIPVSMFADLVRSNGCDVIDLGSETPAETLIEMAERFDGRLVICLTVTHPAGRESAQQTVAALRERYPDLAILVGGRAILSVEDAVGLGSTPFDSSDPSAAATAAAGLAASIPS